MRLKDFVSRLSLICITASLLSVSAYAAENVGEAPQTVTAESIDAASKYYVDALVAGFRKGRELIGAPAPDDAQLAAIRKISVKWLNGKLLPYLKSTPGWLEDWIAAQNSTEIKGFNDKIMTVKTIYEFQQLMAEADQVTRTRFPKLYTALSSPKGKRLMQELQQKIAIESQRQLLKQMKKRNSANIAE